MQNIIHLILIEQMADILGGCGANFLCDGEQLVLHSCTSRLAPLSPAPQACVFWSLLENRRNLFQVFTDFFFFIFVDVPIVSWFIESLFFSLITNMNLFFYVHKLFLKYTGLFYILKALLVCIIWIIIIEFF